MYPGSSWNYYQGFNKATNIPSTTDSWNKQCLIGITCNYFLNIRINKIENNLKAF